MRRSLMTYAGLDSASSAVSQRPVGLLAAIPPQERAGLEPSTPAAQYIDVGSGLLGGWSMVASGGSFGTETWREAEVREERRALLDEIRRRRGGGLPPPGPR